MEDTTLSPPPAPILTLKTCIIRPYHPLDVPFQTQFANNPKIAMQMRRAFPSPYTLAASEAWIKTATDAYAAEAAGGPPACHYAICVPLDDPSSGDGPGDGYSYAVGGIGLKLLLGDIHEHTMEVGYLLAEPYWGRGIMTEAVGAFARWAFGRYRFGDMKEYGLRKLEAAVFEGNEGSRRVLTKAGFVEEGTRRKCVWKDGRYLDLWMFGMLREECPGLEGEGGKE